MPKSYLGVIFKPLERAVFLLVIIWFASVCLLKDWKESHASFRVDDVHRRAFGLATRRLTHQQGKGPQWSTAEKGGDQT